MGSGGWSPWSWKRFVFSRAKMGHKLKIWMTSRPCPKPGSTYHNVVIGQCSNDDNKKSNMIHNEITGLPWVWRFPWGFPWVWYLMGIGIVMNPNADVEQSRIWFCLMTFLDFPPHYHYGYRVCQKRGHSAFCRISRKLPKILHDFCTPHITAGRI